mmetsp:Transcript_2744/g.4215  ORF Transcript_2744/g.4215 Transcript_2744/m.4215 type:complete len:145 (-) Transcript_2744:173-607(-)
MSVPVTPHSISFVMKTHQGIILSLLSKRRKSATHNKKKSPNHASPDRSTSVTSSSTCSSTAPSEPISCPAPAFSHLDEEADYQENVHHYNTKTWQMYHRITEARRKSSGDIPRFDFEEGAEDDTLRRSSRSLSTESYGVFSLDP